MEATVSAAHIATDDEEVVDSDEDEALDAMRGKKRSRDSFSDLENDPMLDAALREAE